MDEAPIGFSWIGCLRSTWRSVARGRPNRAQQRVYFQCAYSYRARSKKKVRLIVSEWHESKECEFQQVPHWQLTDGPQPRQPYDLRVIATKCAAITLPFIAGFSEVFYLAYMCLGTKNNK
jgi:hypothetical protein